MAEIKKLIRSLVDYL